MWEVEICIPLEDIHGQILQTDQRIKDGDFQRGAHHFHLKVNKILPRDSLEALFLRYQATLSSKTKYTTAALAARMMRNYWSLWTKWMTTPVKRRLPRKLRKPRTEPLKEVHWFNVPCFSDSDSNSIDTIVWDYEGDSWS